MTKREKRELLEFLISEARKVNFRFEQTEIFCDKKRNENPDDPWLIGMEESQKKLKYRLTKYDYFIEKLSQELRA